MSATEIQFKVAFGKETFDVQLNGAETTIRQLKEFLETKTQVPVAAQKLLYKGQLQDDKTLTESGLKDGVKVLMMGSRVQDLLNTALSSNQVQKNEVKEAQETWNAQFGWADLPEHKKVLDKGKPEDAEPGNQNQRLPLPPSMAVGGLLNSRGMKTRLTIKSDLQELWIGTNERTQKVPIQGIHRITWQPIPHHEDYCIMAIQLGSTEKSKYYVYWVPRQYLHSLLAHLHQPASDLLF